MVVVVGRSGGKIIVPTAPTYNNFYLLYCIVLDYIYM